MILVTRLNDTRFGVNPDLIERIQEHPDTTLLMVNGERYIVKERLDDVIDLVVNYRARVAATAGALLNAPDENKGV